MECRPQSKSSIPIKNCTATGQVKGERRKKSAKMFQYEYSCLMGKS